MFVCTGGVGGVTVGGWRFIDVGRNCSPRELRLSELMKLGSPLVLTSDGELSTCSLLKYAESPADPESSRRLSLEKGLERRHFDFFSLSDEDPLLGAIAEDEASVSSGGTAGVSC